MSRLKVFYYKLKRKKEFDFSNVFCLMNLTYFIQDSGSEIARWHHLVPTKMWRQVVQAWKRNIWCGFVYNRQSQRKYFQSHGEYEWGHNSAFEFSMAQEFFQSTKKLEQKVSWKNASMSYINAINPRGSVKISKIHKMAMEKTKLEILQHLGFLPKIDEVSKNLIGAKLYLSMLM